MDFETVAWTQDSDANPFRDWNYVYVKYCDGSMHMGQRTEVSDDTWGLYFSGHHSITAIISDLSRTGNSTLNTTGANVIFSGGSAGGVGTFANYEYVATLLPDAKVVGAPVGGFPPEIFIYEGKGAVAPAEDLTDEHFQVAVDLYDAYVPEACANDKKKADRWKCGIPHIVYPHLTIPLFITEALTDSCVLCEFEGLACLGGVYPIIEEAREYSNEYGRNASMNMQQVLETGPARG